jgi:magnesium-transporting ATPase (P-type)
MPDLQTMTDDESSVEEYQAHDLLLDENLDFAFKQLHSSELGLSTDQALKQQTSYGLNRINRLKKTPIIFAFLANFVHTMALLLWVGGAIAFIAKMNQLAVAIWLVNLINGLFSFWQEFKAEKATEALLKLVPKKARVIRDGEECVIDAEQLVPGDIMVVEEGDEIAADARIIEDKGLYVDQSLLTGESAPVRKTARDGKNYHHPNRGHADVLYAGTSVTAGQATALVVATGMHSRFGKIAHLTQSIQAERSPLQKEMVKVTQTVSILAVSIGLAFFLIAILLLGVKSEEGFIFALGMIVAFVPEGMLPTVSLSLAIAVQQMSAKNAVVRRLSSVETLGCTSVICTDKTGTLTRNEMTVTNIWCPDHEISVTGCGYEPAGLICTAGDTKPLTQAPPAVSYLLQAGAKCCNASLISPRFPGTRWNIIGDPTEAAIVVALRKINSYMEAEEVHDQNNPTRFKRIDTLAFDPHRKRMSMLWEVDGKYVSFVKGAPKEILEFSNHTLEGGAFVPLSSSLRNTITILIDEYAQAGLRVLAIAQREFSDRPLAEESVLERDLTFLGLVAMTDPLHEEVPDALTKCHEAGIRVIMITGDYELTALSIARQAGIINGTNARVVTGLQLKDIGDSDLQQMMRNEIIFARTSPEDKLRIVQTLQADGNVVAVTGDGVNDAPALKQADIGIAMGRAGTDVARESADIILRDDNFASIVSAVELGRAVYENIRKFALYVFTSNVAEAVPFAMLLLSRGLIPLPMTLMQVLFIDLGTDMLPAIGLGADSPDPEIMRKKPRDKKQRLLNRDLLLKVFLWYGLIEAAAGTAAYFFANWFFGWPKSALAPVGTHHYEIATTAVVCAVVVCQIATVLCCRTERCSLFKKNVLDNKLLVSGIIVELILLALLMTWTPFKQIFGSELLPPEIVIFVLLWFPIVIALDEVRKAILRRRAG